MPDATDKPKAVKAKNPDCIWDAAVIGSLHKLYFGSMTVRKDVLQLELSTGGS